MAWLSVWSEMQTCIWPSWCHCHSLTLASVKSWLVLPFWYRLTRVVPEKGPLNGCVSLKGVYKMLSRHWYKDGSVMHFVQLLFSMHWPRMSLLGNCCLIVSIINTYTCLIAAFAGQPGGARTRKLNEWSKNDRVTVASTGRYADHLYCASPLQDRMPGTVCLTRSITAHCWPSSDALRKPTLIPSVYISIVLLLSDHACWHCKVSLK